MHELKLWREKEVAYLDHRGNPQVGVWETLVPMIKSDISHVTDNAHRKMLTEMLGQPA